MFYALAKDLTANSDYAIYLLAILNAGSVFGRVLPNFMADLVGPMNVLAPCAAAAGILGLYRIGIVSLAGITVFVVLYGFFAGAYVSLFAPVVAGLAPDMTVIGTWMGMSLFFQRLGGLLVILSRVLWSI